jgi:mono/diheme cytochrome c family protein
MRLKTLGVILTTALAAFTMLYWVTDGIRREAIAAEQEEELLHFGEIVFSDDPAEPAAAGCAQCHGPEGNGGEEGAQVVGPSLRTASLADKLRNNPNYVRLAVSYGGVVAGAEVYASVGCAGCHGQDLAGGVGPSLQNVGNEVGNLPTPVSQQDQYIADYEEDPRAALERWIRDSSANYNDGAATGMPPHPETAVSESQLRALITFLLSQTGGDE